VFLKETTVKRGERRYTYVQLVEGYRDEAGRVRQRVVANLGRKERLKQSGTAEALAAAFARLDPPLAGTRRELGPLLLVRRFSERLGLREAVDRILPRARRAELSVGEVVDALVASRLCSPSPLYDVAGWASQAAVRELYGIPPELLNDDRLGRALEALAPHAEELRGALLLAALERFGADARRLHLDLTTLRVAGAYEDSALVERGWGPDRAFGRQVRALAATDPHGSPLYLRPVAGAASELAVIGAALERLRELLPEPPLVVADSALGRIRALCRADRAGVRFVVPLRAETGFRERYLAEVGPEALRPLRYLSERERAKPVAQRTRYRGALRPFCATDPETGAVHRFRVAYIHSSEEQREVRAARERALAKAEHALRRIERGLGGRYYKTRQQVEKRLARVLAPVEGLLWAEAGTDADRRPTLRFARNAEAIAAAERADGVYALATNLSGRLSAARVLRLYKEQHLVERRHRDLKSQLKVRPIFLHNDDRIEALISVVGIALLIFGLIEAELRARLHGGTLPGLLGEGRAAVPTGRSILAAFQGLGLTYTPQGIATDRLTATQRRILELLEIKIPWPQLDELAA
jgi:Domain of unknown function (DUF4277)/Transposase DDE domain